MSGSSRGSLWRELEEHVMKLITHGIYVIPVKGHGLTLRECKVPMIRRGAIRYVYPMPRSVEEALVEHSYRTLELIRQRRILAFGVPCINNGFACIDIDAYGRLDAVIGWARQLARAGAYVEVTASGGLHIVARIRDGRNVPVAAAARYRIKVDDKTRGYIIAAPSALYIRGERRLLRYRKLDESRDLWEDIAYVDEVRDLLERILVVVDEVDLTTSRIDGNDDRGRAPRLTSMEIRLPSPELVASLLALVYEAADCPGYVAILNDIYSGVWRVPYVSYAQLNPFANHSRSTWTVIEYNLGVACYMIGLDEETTSMFAEWLEQRISRFENDPNLVIDTDAMVNRTPTAKNVMAGYRYRERGLDQRGACVLRLLGLCPKASICTENGVTILLRNAKKILPIIRKLAKLSL
jgi:hypothetical protein